MTARQLDVKLTDQLEREWMADELEGSAVEGESALLIGVYLAVVAFAVGAAWMIVHQA